MTENDSHIEENENCEGPLQPEDIDCESHEFNLGPYFSLRECYKVDDISKLIHLNKGKIRGGDPSGPAIHYRESDVYTSGIFRGQLKNWPLKPKSFRNIADIDDPDDENEKYTMFLNYNKDLKDFIEICPKHNTDFPDTLSDQISIARHFGVDTPLLDWTHNVLVALYFAVNKMFSVPDAPQYPASFVYHIPDENILSEGIPGDLESLSKYKSSSYVNPYNIDRRIDRQKAAFTFHPHPSFNPYPIEVDVYILGRDFMEELMHILLGLGFTYDYFFPDYAGLSEYVSEKPEIF